MLEFQNFPASQRFMLLEVIIWFYTRCIFQIRLKKFCYFGKITAKYFTVLHFVILFYVLQTLLVKQSKIMGVILLWITPIS